MTDPHPAPVRAPRAPTTTVPHRRLRPARFDDLGLRRALGDRLLPCLVAAMAFLAALALAGFVAASALASRWQHGAGASVTVQVPQPGGAADDGAAAGGHANRRERVLAALRAAPGVASATALSDAELADLLRPWLGTGAEALTLPLPAVITVRMRNTGPDLAALRGSLNRLAPGTLVEDQNAWVDRLGRLARSLQASAALALAVVTAVAACVIVVATRSGLVARRATIEIVHGLGATDRYIAGRFAGRASLLAVIGGAIGAAVALPVLLELAALAGPLSEPAAERLPEVTAGGGLGRLPTVLSLALPALPVITGGLGWCTAQWVVRRWLKRLA